MDYAAIARLVGQIIKCPLFTLAVGVTYDSDMRRVRAALERATANLPWRSRKHEPVVLMTAFAVHFDGALHERLDRFPRAS